VRPLGIGGLSPNYNPTIMSKRFEHLSANMVAAVIGVVLLLIAFAYVAHV